MFETPLTVVGRIVSDLRRRTVAGQEVISFRMVSSSRRRLADGSWEAGNSLFITVTCWGNLVTGVGAALGKGSSVIAVGQIYTSEYDDKDGIRRSSLEMRATTVGPDLSRVIVRILDKVSVAAKDAEPATDAEQATDGQPGTDGEPGTDAEPHDAKDDEPEESKISRRTLPLSA
jgi:single-strand DNA-binding protein